MSSDISTSIRSRIITARMSGSAVTSSNRSPKHASKAQSTLQQVSYGKQRLLYVDTAVHWEGSTRICWTLSRPACVDRLGPEADTLRGALGPWRWTEEASALPFPSVARQAGRQRAPRRSEHAGRNQECERAYLELVPGRLPKSPSHAARASPPPCSHAPYLRASSFPQVHISNLPDSLGEEELHMVFQRYGSILRVKKIKDYAFVNFAVRGRHGGLLVSLMFLHWF